MIFLIFITSGLFLGWSLGANDAGNIFGSAVGTKMLRFRTAAIVFSIFVVLGAVLEGSGTAGTLNNLGAVNALGGAFIVAFSAALTVFLFNRLCLPVSTTQAIVGSIIGWNLFTGSYTDPSTLFKIISSWVICPVLSAIFAVLIYLLFKRWLLKFKVHMLLRDAYVRILLIVIGAIASYSLGSNNMANVMGVFINDCPFRDIYLFNFIRVTAIQQLFFLGGMAIIVGVFTYSGKVMNTVGKSIVKLSPEMGLVVVLSQALVLYLFSSVNLEHKLLSMGLPAIPLVPVSCSQAVVGAIIGLGLLKSPKGIKFNVLGRISMGWVTTPISTCVITFVLLFFMQNVFDQKITQPYTYRVNQHVIEYLDKNHANTAGLYSIKNITYSNLMGFKTALRKNTNINGKQEWQIIQGAEIRNIYIDSAKVFQDLDTIRLSKPQYMAFRKILKKDYDYGWDFLDKLESIAPEWKNKPNTKLNKLYNRDMDSRRRYVLNLFEKKD